ncbi:MAG: Smr/MutS family protein [Parvularculaceae bacterium]|jgi:DNA-nicking Smr family endonuclease|nr:Smr/MutS family protein [Parvularculaceae bacterium]
MRRRVTEEEEALLAKALADVKPLKQRRKQAPRTTGPKQPSPPSRSRASGEERASPEKAPPPKQRVHSPARPSVLAAGDPRLDAKARRGKVEIERTLDLHGLTQDAAYGCLLRFIDAAHKDDCRCVLVVTGKGATIDALSRLADPAPRGILRGRFLEWIEGPTMRERVSRVAKAAPRHGGAGAFYVFLKRRRQTATRRPS